MTTWTNWSGGVTCQPVQFVQPSSEDELQKLVQQAKEADLTIRVTGTGHSFMPLCASDGLLISLDNLQGVVSTDQANLTGVVWAGSKIHQLGELLHQAGLAMENMGDIDRQAIAGAISTGTHGTGRGIGNISTQVSGLRLILASGEVLDCDFETEPDIFRAAQVSLGALGLISQIRLRLLPTYRLHEKTWILPTNECMANLDDLIRSNRHFEFFWLPKNDTCAMKALNPTKAALSEVQEIDHDAPPGTAGRYVSQERVDHSYKIFPSERNVRFNETEFTLPEDQGVACFQEVRRCLQKKYPNVVWPIEYRTLGADEAYLSPAYQRHSVTISVHEGYELPYQTFFAAVEEIFRHYQGRPHWGKVHTHTATELQKLYPHWDDFQIIRQKLDPQGRFLNDHLRTMFAA